jgi:hypothetical protein
LATAVVATDSASDLTVPRKPLRTGRLKKRLRASTVVPKGRAAVVDSTISPAETRTRFRGSRRAAFTGREREMGDGANGVQGFAAEAL